MAQRPPLVLFAAALVAATLAAFAAAPNASATIVPQRSIAGIALGMTRAQVQARLGAPPRVVRTRSELGRFTEWRYRTVSLSFREASGVIAVWTTSPRERTARGVGVGSRERAVRRTVRGVRCRTIAGVRSCIVGAELPGRRVTAFFLRRGRVVRVVVGIVVD